MHKTLKKILWRRVDRAFESRFLFKPRKRGANWRLYTAGKADDMVFVTVEYFDTAGGKFSVCGGASRGGLPEKEDVPAKRYVEPPLGGYTLVSAQSFGLPAALIEVELAWQTPSRSLIEAAFRHSDAKLLLAQLGVTLQERHHLLSYGILESVGLEIPEREFDQVERAFQLALERTLTTSVDPMIARLRQLAKVAAGTRNE